MRCNAQGLEIIKKYEGLIDGDPDTPGLDPYICPAGRPTIGWGSTWDEEGNPVTMAHPPITVETATVLLQRELSAAEKTIAQLVKVPLTENMFSALCSLIYNIGSGNFAASTLRAKLNRENYEGAANEFPKWRRSRGQILPGLILRRAAERELFNA